jgi:hypothetical protein
MDQNRLLVISRQAGYLKELCDKAMKEHLIEANRGLDREFWEDGFCQAAAVQCQGSQKDQDALEYRIMALEADFKSHVSSPRHIYLKSQDGRKVL